MSFALIKSIRSIPMHSTTKLVALTIATYADDHDYCYPTIQLLMTDTGLSNRAVCEHISHLESFGILTVDRGNGRKSKYQFNPANFESAVTLTQKAVTHDHQLPSVTSDSRNTKAVTLTQQPVTLTQKAVTESHTNSQEQPIEQPIGTANKRTTKKRSPETSFSKPDGVEQKHWDGWMAVRKTKRAPMTESVMDYMIREAALAGISIPDAVRECAGRNWQNFKADWYLPKNYGQKPTQNQPAANGKKAWDFDAYLDKPQTRTIQDEGVVPCLN